MSQVATTLPAPRPSRAERLARANRVLGLKLALVVPVMLVFCASLVPLYRAICDQLGISQTRAPVPLVNTQVDVSRWINIELIAHRNRGMGWIFEPMEKSVRVHPGELTTVRYRVVNTQDHPLTGRAVHSLSPLESARHFSKLECFCFTDQTLAPGESREMPVVFRIDPAMAKEIGTISLAYTFFDVTELKKGAS